MSKTKVNSIIAILAIVMLILANSVVFAADANYKVGITLTSDSKLKEGETVVVNVNLSNVAGGDGVSGIGGSLVYDKNVFEAVSSNNAIKSDNFKFESGWSIVGNAINDSTGKISLMTGSKVTKPSKIMTVTFKVKSTINTDSTTIYFTGATASDGINEVEVPTSQVTISREKAAETKTDPETPKKTTPAPTKVTQKNTTVKNGTKADNTTAKKNIPKTGLSQSGIAVIVAIVIVGGICYVVYRKKYDDVK